jgi:hypothetical protein
MMKLKAIELLARMQGYSEPASVQHNHLHLRAKPTKDELRAQIDSRDSERVSTGKTVEDLTFGELIRSLGTPTIWSRTGLGLDRALFVENLDEVRRIRNKVMHFHPDGISPSDRAMLGKVRRMLQAL